MAIKKSILVLACIALIVGCKDPVGVEERESIMEYAAHITVAPMSHGFTAQVANPWKSNTLLHSYTYSDSLSTDYTFSRQHNTIHLPLQRVVVMTNSLAHLMVEIGAEGSIAGVCEPEYISDSTINALLKQGAIADCGNSMYPTIERIMELKPDAIMVSPFEETGYGQLEKLGIPLIECADYMETSPLGRAEWMRYYGLLFGAGESADSLFHEVSSRYNSLCDIAATLPEHPRVMLDTKSGSAWYTAGGGSTIGQMIAHAGGDYIFAENTNSGSVPLSFESVFERGSDSDVWLLKNSSSAPFTYDLLEADYKPYSRFKPFKTHNIWVCDVNRVPYFEVTSFHPELLLEEFIAIFHPSYTPSTPLLFYHPM